MLSVRVVKLGGHELDRPEWLAACADALKALGPVVLVHGGGEAVSALSQRLALPIEKRDGRRVTSAAVAEVVEMGLAGPVNRMLAAALRQRGRAARGGAALRLGRARRARGRRCAAGAGGGRDRNADRAGRGHRRHGRQAPRRCGRHPRRRSRRADRRLATARARLRRHAHPPACRQSGVTATSTAASASPAALLGVYARVGPLFVAGNGAELVAEDGTRYLDFVAGIGVNALGYNHPVVREAVERALGPGLVHVSNLYRTEPRERLA